MSRPLVVIAHGTASAAGRRVVHDLAGAAGAVLGIGVRVGFVDVWGPEADEVLAGSHEPVVVPLFIGGGYHVQGDVPRAAALATGATLAPHLGADPAVVGTALDRLREAGFDEPDAGWAVVVAAAGSQRASVRAEIEAIAAVLSRRLGVPASTAYLSAAQPRVPVAVADLVAQGRRVAVANVLLAPGAFADRLAAEATAAGADIVAAPLGVHEDLVAAIVRRYRGAVGMS
ncbi:MAG: sirohydrochlorin chelatase [Propionibacterium sp.]|nr:sirohydrochlorin chelatase [Propionibacterium sp.]